MLDVHCTSSMSDGGSDYVTIEKVFLLYTASASVRQATVLVSCC